MEAPSHITLLMIRRGISQQSDLLIIYTEDLYRHLFLLHNDLPIHHFPAPDAYIVHDAGERSPLQQVGDVYPESTLKHGSRTPLSDQTAVQRTAHATVEIPTGAQRTNPGD